MAEVNGEACSVCQGSGRPGDGMIRCICGGDGTRKAEVDNLRALAEALRSELERIRAIVAGFGFTATKPSEIAAAVERLGKRCIDAEEEFVKLKRQRAT